MPAADFFDPGGDGGHRGPLRRVLAPATECAALRGTPAPSADLLATTYGAEAVDRATGPRPVVWRHTGGLVPAVERVSADVRARAVAPGGGGER